MGVAAAATAGYFATTTAQKKEHHWVLYKMPSDSTVWTSLDRMKLDKDIRAAIDEIQYFNRERLKDVKFKAGEVLDGAEIWMPKEYLLHPENIVPDPNYQAQSGVKDGR